MSNYSFYNLSFQAREESSVVSRIISNVAEGFVFTYLGLTLISYVKQRLCLSFIIIELFIVVFARILSIFGLCYLFQHVFKIKSFHMKTSQKGIMCCAGSIRGAIAFGLAISIETPNTIHKDILVSSTLILVFFTTIVFGAMMPLMINLMKKFDRGKDIEINKVVEKGEELTELKCDHFNFLHPNFSEKYEGSKEKNIEILKTRISYWLGHYWLEFDDMIIKPYLCYEWPWTKVDGLNVKKVILTNLIKYEEEERTKPHFIRRLSVSEKNSDAEKEEIKDNLSSNLLQNSSVCNNNSTNLSKNYYELQTLENEEHQ